MFASPATNWSHRKEEKVYILLVTLIYWFNSPGILWLQILYSGGSSMPISLGKMAAVRPLCVKARWSPLVISSMESQSLFSCWYLSVAVRSIKGKTPLVSLLYLPLFHCFSEEGGGGMGGTGLTRQDYFLNECYQLMLVSYPDMMTNSLLSRQSPCFQICREKGGGGGMPL